MKKIVTGLTLAAAVALAGPAHSLLLNEIRVDQSGADTDEYVELSGSPGASLAGVYLIVIGDGTGGCGVVEAAIDLSAYSIQGDGLFALRYSGGTALLTGYDATLTGSFENSDNLTFFLVSGSTATVAMDLDTDNDGVLDIAPWSTVIDGVAIYEGVAIDCSTNEYTYSSVVVGPDGNFSPGHIYRCGNDWLIGPFGGVLPTGGTDTPGDANNCPVPVQGTTWGGLKARF